MKIALCLSGQPRSYEKGYEYLKKNLLDHHDVDVFIHTWSYPIPIELIDDIEQLFSNNLKDVHYEKPLNEQCFTKYSVGNRQYPAYNTGSMYYSLLMSNQLQRKYALTNKIDYDVVIRSRFDFALNKVLPYNEVVEGKVYLSNCRQDPTYRAANDQFAYGTPYVMNLYSQTFNNMDFLYNNGCPFNGEELMCANLGLYDLLGENMVYVDVNHPFMPDRYGSMRHSLIRDDFSNWNKFRG